MRITTTASALLAASLAFTSATEGHSSHEAKVYPNDFRVAPALGDRSRTSVRLTYTAPLSQYSNDMNSAFDYNSVLAYRWSTLRVHTGLFDAPPGETTSFAIPTQNPFNLTVPKLGEGVRGLMIGDVCFETDIATCETAEHDEIGQRLPTLMNLILSKPGVSFWGLVGDNFYDPDGSLSREFWSQLSLQAKSTLFITAPGNYDFWSSGDPEDVDVHKDQFGNGFMQFYGMDTLSSLSSPTGCPWNFTVNPDNVDLIRGSKSSGIPNQHYLPEVSNFEYFSQIGNIGVMGFSGAHHHDEIKPFLARACQWFTEHSDTIDWIFLTGHWAQDTKGASSKTTVPHIYGNLIKDYGCDPAITYYFQGHYHCNMPMPDGHGFLVAGFGKNNNHCSQFGIPYVDSTGGRLQVIYFPISQKMVPDSDDDEEEIMHELRGANDRYDALVTCATTASSLADDCLHLEHEVWLNVSSQEARSRQQQFV